jgi:hypothetical protein
MDMARADVRSDAFPSCEAQMIIILSDDKTWTTMQATITRIDGAVTTMQAAITRIDRAVALVAQQQLQEIRLMTALDDAFTGLTTQVTANTDAEASAITLLKQLADLIQANATSPAQVTALAAKLKSSADALGAAIIANTPAG